MYRQYGNGTSICGPIARKGYVEGAFLYPHEGRRLIQPCEADRKRSSKSSMQQKKKPKKPVITGRGKVTLTQEQKEQIEKIYRAHIAVTDSKTYVENLALHTHVEVHNVNNNFNIL
ncbi:uncharacterized protein BXIN_0063 [Babesia sp. Xinjiang]|uniref:uncharacterized protein n=1 Tax=Babesia sp. Xinjiang TaxID=462227 RepID=UPI000A2605FC|nr:uncharacterized protein BXIN_0063 [Babesia sp. Xinjiang]ORM39664.1 hypothetical protein BXIN_0063 [Babesia sp. Xinjiang]